MATGAVAPPPAALVPSVIAVGAPRASLPLSWFRDPLDAKIKKLIRPSTALTRRKELVIEMRVPREVFEDFMSPLTESDAAGLTRDATTQQLVPTRPLTSLRRFKYDIRKGSVSDRLFHLDTLDPPDPTRPPAATAEKAEIGEAGVYEVETILEKRTRGKRTEYLIKWLDWPTSTNTWETAARIDRALVAAFEGKPLPAVRLRLPSRPKRGVGCARARLSGAAERGVARSRRPCRWYVAM